MHQCTHYNNTGSGPFCTQCGERLTPQPAPSFKSSAISIRKVLTYLGIVVGGLMAAWLLYIVWQDPAKDAGELQTESCSSTEVQAYIDHNQRHWVTVGGHLDALNDLFFQYDINPVLLADPTWNKNIQSEAEGLHHQSISYANVDVPKMMSEIHTDMDTLIKDISTFSEQIGPAIESGRISDARTSVSRLTDRIIALTIRVIKLCNNE